MEKLLTHLPFWPYLSENEKDRLRQRSFVRNYKKNTIISNSNNECLGMLLVIFGEVRTYLLSDEGREVTLFRMYADELCVLSASCVISQITFETQMVASKDTKVLIIPVDTVALLKENNIHARCFIYELATKRFSDVMWAMQQILFKGLDRRLAGFLLAEARRTNSNVLFMTHEQIARYISSAREAVARMFKNFAEAGLVDMKRGTITLLDIEGLKELE